MDDSGNICRTTYLAFSMAKREGTIEAGRTTQVEYNLLLCVLRMEPLDRQEHCSNKPAELITHLEKCDTET